jgi:hypothetical protein
MYIFPLSSDSSKSPVLETVKLVSFRYIKVRIEHSCPMVYLLQKNMVQLYKSLKPLTEKAIIPAKGYVPQPLPKKNLICTNFSVNCTLNIFSFLF